MKLHIQKSEKYKSHDIDIPDWFAKKEGFYNQFRSMAEITRESEKAVMIKLSRSGEEHWIPRSVCKITVRNERRLIEF